MSNKPVIFTIEDIIEMEDMMWGGCLNCGAIRECCEPDARRYPCEECGKKAVYGAQELVLMGRVR